MQKTLEMSFPHFTRTATEMYSEGKSLKDIATQFNVSASGVHKALRRLGVTIRPKPTTDKWNARKEELEYLTYIQDLSQTSIGEYYGVSQGSVFKAMKRLGIKARNRGSRGPRNGHYKDGKHSRLYRLMIEKDRCAKCGCTDKLGIHHKNNDHYDNHLENLQVLCNSCHMSITKQAWWDAKKAGLNTPKGNGPLGWRRK